MSMVENSTSKLGIFLFKLRQFLPHVSLAFRRIHFKPFVFFYLMSMPGEVIGQHKG